MPRLIDADKIFDGKLLRISAEAYDAVHAIIEKINNAPTVDAVPVRHGHWENYLTEGLRWKCSECGSRFSAPYHYCPNCGAKMDEVEDAETD